MLTRDRQGLVRYRVSTLAVKVSEDWGRASPVCGRTIKRYLRRLEEVGLVENTGRRTSGGCRLRRIYGRQAPNADVLEVPEATARMYGDGYEPVLFRDSREETNPCAKSLRVPPVSRCVSRCEVPALAEYGVGEGAVMSSSGGRGERVGVEGDGDRAFPKEEKAPAKVAGAGPSFSGGAKNARTAPGVTTPESFPPYPTETVGHYSHPAMPKIAQSDTNGDRLRKMVNGYRAAMEKHTGKPCFAYTRGLPTQVSIQLLRAAKLLEKHRLSPTLWCVGIMAWQRADSKEKQKAWKPPDIRSLYAPAMIEKLRGMVRANRHDWRGAYWSPPRVPVLCERWNECRRQIRLAACKPGAVQEDLERVVSEFFPRGYWENEVELARREMQAKFTQQAMKMRQGRWVW